MPGLILSQPPMEQLYLLASYKYMQIVKSHNFVDLTSV